MYQRRHDISDISLFKMGLHGNLQRQPLGSNVPRKDGWTIGL